MTEYEVSFTVSLEQEVSEADLEEFLEFQLGVSCILPASNPLVGHDIHGLDVFQVSVQKEQP